MPRRASCRSCLISGAQERETRLAGLDAGADDFLNKPVDPEELQTRVRSLMRLKRLTDDLESAESLFLTLGRIIEARDPCTEGHCERLADYATALGRTCGSIRPISTRCYRGAFLHDVGKIAIPDRVLLKKGRLTREGIRADEAASRHRRRVVRARSDRSKPSAPSSAITTSGSTAAAIPTAWPATAFRCSRRSSASSTSSTRSPPIARIARRCRRRPPTR